MISVAIVEDNLKLRSSLELLLNDSPGFRCAGAYANAEDALIGLPQFLPEVVLMDINLPQLSGIECTRRLKQLLPRLQVIIITVYGDNESIFNALRAGASGYLLKSSHPDEILQAVQVVHGGGSSMSSEIARKVVQAFQQPDMSTTPATSLSTREQEVLALLAKGLPDKQIADALKLSYEGVRYHLRHIYEKLQVRSRTEAALKHATLNSHFTR